MGIDLHANLRSRHPPHGLVDALRNAGLARKKIDRGLDLVHTLAQQSGLQQSME